MVPSNERLAEVYNPNYRQLIIVWPLVWGHLENGGWVLH
jgi:hypothetical protein